MFFCIKFSEFQVFFYLSNKKNNVFQYNSTYAQSFTDWNKLKPTGFLSHKNGYHKIARQQIISDGSADTNLYFQLYSSLLHSLQIWFPTIEFEYPLQTESPSGANFYRCILHCSSFYILFSTVFSNTFILKCKIIWIKYRNWITNKNHKIFNKFYAKCPNNLIDIFSFMANHTDFPLKAMTECRKKKNENEFKEHKSRTIFIL